MRCPRLTLPGTHTKISYVRRGLDVDLVDQRRHPLRVEATGSRSVSGEYLRDL